MSCPDWKSLVAHRVGPTASPDREPPAEWPRAIEHLSDCLACRQRALSLDPSLLFVVQAPLPVSDDEVAGIKANVRTLVRARAAERTSHHLRRRLGRVAAAAAVVGLLVLLPTHSPRRPGSVEDVAPGPAVETTPFVQSEGALAEAPAPVIEPLDLPSARIYQLSGGDLSVVMVVDDSIDV